MKQFQSYINDVMTDINNICAYCNLFILFETSILLSKVHLKFVLAMEVIVIVNDNLDYYKCSDNDSHFCNFFYGIIIKKKIPKSGFTNYINVLP